MGSEGSSSWGINDIGGKEFREGFGVDKGIRTVIFDGTVGGRELFFFFLFLGFVFCPFEESDFLGERFD